MGQPPIPRTTTDMTRQLPSGCPEPGTKLPTKLQNPECAPVQYPAAIETIAKLIPIATWAQTLSPVACHCANSLADDQSPRFVNHAAFPLPSPACTPNHLPCDPLVVAVPARIASLLPSLPNTQICVTSLLSSLPTTKIPQYITCHCCRPYQGKVFLQQSPML